jgi:glycosyltransferase involved in cell wall biosynthesis
MKPPEKTKADKVKYSIVVAVYNSEECLEEAFNKIIETMETLEGKSEIIFVDDCSTDGSAEILQRLSSLDSRVKVFRSPSNKGHAISLQKGFDESHGEIIVSLDDDLQQSPDDIPKLIAKLNGGFDVVCGWRTPRKDPLQRVIISKIGNFIMRKTTGIPLHDIGCTLRAYRKNTVNNLALHRGDISFIPYILFKRNHKITEVKIKHLKRFKGISSYSSLSIILMEIQGYIRLFLKERRGTI